MTRRAQPFDQPNKIGFGHGRAAGRRPVQTAPDVKKNRTACARHRRIGIMPDLNEPAISKIARAHFFMRVVVGWIFRVNDNVPIVMWRARVVAPNVRFGHLMIWIIRAWRQVCVVTENLADLENTRRRATVALLFVKTGLVLAGQTCSPGESTFSKQHRNWTGRRLQFAATWPFDRLNL